MPTYYLDGTAWDASEVTGKADAWPKAVADQPGVSGPNDAAAFCSQALT